MNFRRDALFPESQEKLASETLAKRGYATNRQSGVRGVPLRASA
jgi:hypothetical protein